MFLIREIESFFTNTKGTTTWEDIIKLRQQSRDMLWDYWITNTVFSFNWWFLLTTVVIFLVVWLWLLDKKKIMEIINYGLMISTFGFILDLTGITLVLWSYPDRLIPITTPILEIHILHMPIIYMLMYQYFPTWKSFLIAMTITAFVFAFIFEPFILWLGIYKMYHWEYIFSFPFYIIIGVVFKWLIIKLKQVEKESKITRK